MDSCSPVRTRVQNASNSGLSELVLPKQCFRTQKAIRGKSHSVEVLIEGNAPAGKMRLCNVSGRCRLPDLVPNPYQAMVCKLALKLGLRDQEVKFGEFTDIIWSESVYRVRSKPKFNFTVKDYEQRDIPIPTDFLDELKIWKENRPTQNLIVPTKTGRPNGKLLKMVKRLARRAKIECGWCPNCVAGVKGECGCDEFELHKFRRTCITTWLRNKIDPRTVMAYAGHADLETTLRYLRPAAAQERIAEVSEIKWY